MSANDEVVITWVDEGVTHTLKGSKKAVASFRDFVLSTDEIYREWLDLSNVLRLPVYENVLNDILESVSKDDGESA